MMLGYKRFVAHGGDIGAGVTTALALLHGERLHGIHLNYIPGSYRPFLDESVALTAEEREWQARRDAWNDAEGGYSHVQATKPDVLGPALNDSPIGLAAWIIDKYRSWSDCDGHLDKRFSVTELLTVISIYWFTECNTERDPAVLGGAPPTAASHGRPARHCPGRRCSFPEGDSNPAAQLHRARLQRDPMDGISARRAFRRARGDRCTRG